ncbi:MAG: hypothetical protein JWM60_1689 [Solirubrobacterales bacterium]|nr:hypothetical protein [Solirubrobacterales bacterium]
MPGRKWSEIKAERVDLDAQIERARNDPEFQRRLAESLERNREALDRLTKGDEGQADL